MKYPYWSNYIEIIDENDGIIKLFDIDKDETIYATEEEVYDAQLLDGHTEPSVCLQCKDDAALWNYLKHLREKHLIRMDYGYSTDGEFSIVKAIRIYNHNDFGWIRNINILLAISFFPALITCLYILIKESYYCYDIGLTKSLFILEIIAGCLFGLIIGKYIQELAMAMSASEFGARVLELDLQFFPFIDLSYEIYDEKLCRSAKAQMLLAGTESSIVLAALSAVFYHACEYHVFFLSFSKAAIILAIIHMIYGVFIGLCSVVDNLLNKTPEAGMKN